MTRLSWSLLFAVAVVLGGGGASGADELHARGESEPESAPKAVFQVTPYAWASGLAGDVSPFRRVPTVRVEKAFADIFEQLEVAGFVNLYGRYGRWVLSADVMYVNLTDSETFGPLPYIGATDARFNTAQFSATLAGGYRAVDTGRFTFDVLGGFRHWHLWNKLEVSAAGRQFTVKSDYGWTDPLVGARAHVHLTDAFSVLAQGDIGGFGVGADSTWQLLVTANYKMSERLALSVGYKALSVDYDADGHVFQSTLSGPVAGLTLRF
ncbi:hypothetical protein [Stappia stellulata]|uniref:hypothetical protein n=1 Tax=Stappia stellulata TaxID=71235 RepID=UPI0009FFE9EB|nr:hypothetical protein [Stappia stellulata]